MLNAKFRVIENKNDSYLGENKIYEIINGFIICEKGDRWNFVGHKTKQEAQSELEQYYKIEWIKEEEEKMKIVKQDSYKVGDKVKIREDLKIGYKYGEDNFVKDMEKVLGKIVTIKTRHSANEYRLKEIEYWWTNEMIEGKIIEEERQMTKSDLKNGMVIEYRNGKKRLVLNDRFIGENQHMSFNSYNEKLLMKNSYEKEYDIIKVYKTNAKYLSDVFNSIKLEVIWKRQEKTPQQIKIEELEATIKQAQRQIEELKESEE